MKIASKVLLCGGAFLALAASPAVAQSPEQSEDGPDMLVVTATKMERFLSQVPLSVGVADMSALQRYGAQDASSLLGRIAGLSIETGQPGFTRFVIRGVNAGGQFGWRQSAATAIYLDESPLTTRTNFFFASPDINLFDMARVEVLRGPQGTLYGASAIGGAVRAIPNAPDASRFSATVEGELSSTQDSGDPNYALRAAVNLPLVKDRLALRLVADHMRNAGFIDAILLRDQDFVAEAATAPRIRDYNDQERLTLRATLAFTPTDRITIQPAITWQRNDAGGAGDFALNSFGRSNRATVFAFNPQFERDGTPYEFVRDDLLLASLKASVDLDTLGGITLASVTSWQDRRAQGRDDSIASNGSWVVAFGLDDAYTGLDPSFGDFGTKVRQFSQELRVVTNGNQAVQFVGGLFFNRLRQTDTIRYSFAGSPQAVFDTYGIADPINYDGRDNFAEDEYAAFGNIDWRLDGGVTLGGGLRVTRYDQSLQRGAAFPAFADPGDLADPARLTAAETVLTPRFVASWQATPSLLGYVSATRGFRTGGGNPPENLRGQCPDRADFPAQPAQFDADSAWSYELGGKFASRDGRIAVNAAAYQLDWNDIQTAVSFTCSDNSVIAYTGNAGRARIRGFELEGTFALSKALTLTASAAHTDALFREDAPEAGITAGQRIGYVPQWTFNAGLAWQQRQALFGAWRGHAAIDWRHVGERIDPLYGSAANPDFGADLPAQNLVDARLGLRTDRIDISVFARNLFNADVAVQQLALFATNAFRPTGVDTRTVREEVVLRPRTIGLTARLRY